MLHLAASSRIFRKKHPKVLCLIAINTVHRLCALSYAIKAITGINWGKDKKTLYTLCSTNLVDKTLRIPMGKTTGDSKLGPKNS